VEDISYTQGRGSLPSTIIEEHGTSVELASDDPWASSLLGSSDLRFRIMMAYQLDEAENYELVRKKKRHTSQIAICI